jgi:Tol biopolymer transport system component
VSLIDRDGRNLRQVFLDGHNQQRPSFSPDGTKVALIVCNLFAIDGSGEVFVIDLKTQEVTPVRTNTGSSLVPDTSMRLNWVR